MSRRVLLLLAVAVPLTAADLLHKAVADTPFWAYHPRGAAWLVLAAAVVAGSVALTRVPSRAVSGWAGLLAAGAAGNGIAAVAWDAGVPNPIVLQTDSYLAALNLADVFTLVGICTLMVTLVVVSIRNRAMLLPPRELARHLLQRLR